MKKRVTLTIDEECIRHAKAYSKKKGKSLSQLVEDYFALYGKPLKTRRKEDLPPLTRSLTGILESAEMKDYKEYRDEYFAYLEEKHR